MLYLENTNLEGERMTFGEAQKFFKQFGIFIGGNWEYDRGMFDGVLHRENGETIYFAHAVYRCQRRIGQPKSGDPIRRAVYHQTRRQPRSRL